MVRSSAVSISTLSGILLLILSMACLATNSSAQERTRPNIIYIMADDLGYADLSGFGGTNYTTPALDGLAEDGVRFSQAYAIAPVCSPTRIGLVTGQHPARFSAGLHEPIGHDDGGLAPSAAILSSRLKEAGYQTGVVGKWHLGRTDEFRPAQHNYDRSYVIRHGAADYVSHKAKSPNSTGNHDLYKDGVETFDTGYLTHLFTKEAEAFLRTATPPFFLNLEYNAPHWPWQQPGDPAYPEDAHSISYGGSPEIYAGMMGALDDGVDRILNVLDELGYAEDTLIIFTSDNGGDRFSSMGEFKGMKLQLWEGGIRVPAFVRWPGQIPKGVTTEQVATTLDWTATMLAAAGVATTTAIEGTNLLPHLRGETEMQERTVYWRSNAWGLQHAVRHGDWKYLRVDEPHNRPGRVQQTGEFLFNLKSDPGESINLSMREPEVLSHLRSLYAEWNANVLPPINP